MTGKIGNGRLEGKIILLTGTGSGMGQGIALRYAQEGAKVYGCDISEKGNAETLELLKQHGVTMNAKAPVDLSDPDQCKAWIDEVGEACGHVDVLFNNASSPRFGPMPYFSVEDWQYAIRNELDLVFYAAKFAWPYLARKGGIIISTASTSAHVSTPKAGMVSHCAAKGGVLAMSRVFADDGAQYGIRAVTISPGAIRTPELKRNWLNKVPNAEEITKETLLTHRIGEVEDIAGLAVYLASDEASFITGTDIIIDGGMTAL